MNARTLRIFLIVTGAFLSLTARQAPAQSLSIDQATLDEPDAKTQEVNTEQLRRMMTEGNAMVLDARSRAEYDSGHIPGAVNVDAPSKEQV